MKRILCIQEKKITSNTHDRKIHPQEMCRNQKGINKFPGLNWAHSGWGCWNCHWLWDSMGSHEHRLMRIRNFPKWLLKGVSLFLSSPLLLWKAWASALMEEFAVPVPNFSLLSISKSSWDPPRAKISFCLLHWDSQTWNSGKGVTSKVTCHGSQAAWGVQHMSLLFLGSLLSRGSSC